MQSLWRERLLKECFITRNVVYTLPIQVIDGCLGKPWPVVWKTTSMPTRDTFAGIMYSSMFIITPKQWLKENLTPEEFASYMAEVLQKE